MTSFSGYRCSICGQDYGPAYGGYVCARCQGNLDIELDYERIRRERRPEFDGGEPSLWRYLPLLPVGDPGGTGTPLRSAGWTPAYRLQRFERELGLRTLYCKDESRNPTASFKDRASAVVVARGRELGSQVIVTASTGNAGAALAGMAAAVGQKAVIFAPRSAPPAKVAQLVIYGAEVILVDGNYDAAFDLTVAAAERFNWYCRNTGYNPFSVEGKKTAALEIWETLLRAQPERTFSIFVSVGDGNIISGIHKGFRDLAALGWLEKMPRLYGVQAEGSAAVANAFDRGDEVITPVQAATLADSISVDLPRDGVRAVRAARQTSGSYIRVTDAEILQAIVELGSAGIFAEPAGAASFAGLWKAAREGWLDADEPVLVVNTGSGLKDVRAAAQAAAAPAVIEPSLSALERYLHDRKSSEDDRIG